MSLGRHALRGLGAKVGCFYVAQTSVAILLGGVTGRPVAALTVAILGILLSALVVLSYPTAFPDGASSSWVAATPGHGRHRDLPAPWRQWLARGTGILAPPCALTVLVAWFTVTDHWSLAAVLTANVAAGAGAGLVLSAGPLWGWVACGAALACDVATMLAMGEPVGGVGLSGAVVVTGVATVAATFIGRGFATTEEAMAGADLAVTAQQVSAERWSARQKLDRALHDTVLSTLSVLAQPQMCVSPQQVRQECARDVRVLESAHAGAAGDHLVHSDPGADYDLDLVVSHWAARDLHVRVHGSAWHDAGARLSDRVEHALLAALHECLSNVVRHAETDVADLVVMDRPSAVALQVVDGGRGFDTAAVPVDRLGLTSSVRARIVDAGGTAEVWSRPGSGTSVLLTVPAQEVSP